MGAGDLNLKATMDKRPCTITQRTAPTVPKNNVHNNAGMKPDYKAQGLRCLYTNAQRMGNKQNELGLLTHEGKYDLIGITETGWDDSHDWNIAIEGCKFYT